MDPYSQEPLRFRHTADGLMVYSVGPDRIDNDGRFDPRNLDAPGTNFTFRLWDPSHRRQPPIPAVKPNDDDILNEFVD
jgi:hypothetical protein